MSIIKEKGHLRPNTSVQQRMIDAVQHAISDKQQELSEIRRLDKCQALEKQSVDIDLLIKNRIERASHEAVRVLLGEDFEEPVNLLPSSAIALWNKRSEEASDNNPINFLERHWGAYLNVGVLDQCKLRLLDSPLVESVKMFCRNRGFYPQTYLPPAAVQRRTKKSADKSVARELPTPKPVRPGARVAFGERQSVRHQTPENI